MSYLVAMERFLKIKKTPETRNFQSFWRLAFLKNNTITLRGTVLKQNFWTFGFLTTRNGDLHLIKPNRTAQKMKFSIKDFSNKWESFIFWWRNYFSDTSMQWYFSFYEEFMRGRMWVKYSWRGHVHLLRTHSPWYENIRVRIRG